MMTEDWTETIAKMTKQELEKALVIAVGALSTTQAFADKTPDQVFDWLWYAIRWQENSQQNDKDISETLRDYCVSAVVEFMREGMTRHISYVNSSDLLTFENIPQLKSGGRIPKLTIEWVDENETNHA